MAQYVTHAGTTETVKVDGPVRLQGVFPRVSTSTGTVSLFDDNATGGTAVFTLDATVSTDLFGAVFGTGLTVDGSAAGTDITVVYESYP